MKQKLLKWVRHHLSETKLDSEGRQQKSPKSTPLSSFIHDANRADP
jgi:hypothetical protein